MKQRPADLAELPRAREMAVYRKYFDLIAAGQKTIEVRVAYPKHHDLAAGHLLRFTCRNDEVLTRIVRVGRYANFDEMFDNEAAVSVNPTASREDQLADIRDIYLAEKEQLGVLAIEIELVTA
ncbi:ASCH domain-containing protein [Actinoplanes derwentensis]|uniref:ASC-1 homology (ASCH) domain-containing protein n=1 Tax=Actinoplanes derwentensis TaxID=113562 RepID=A0A1H2CWE6_9ACTN|nr:ASCH domain-containing protein [Actinoplanes derwentensis]GID82067.1 hypothetical protein Ade03nite_09910 [Actinoplanes derwentensis]SDT74532.1 ASC-1 homology (ASCH) domain-containing protein [Actinoplanes derwentensis]